MIELKEMPMDSIKLSLRGPLSVSLRHNLAMPGFCIIFLHQTIESKDRAIVGNMNL